LAPLAQPDAVQATVRFEDGTLSVCKEFGLANPSIGLVVIHLGDALSRKGLDLSPTTPTASPVPVALVGWQWGQALAAVVGRLGAGPATGDLATRLGVEAPADKWDLLIFNGLRLGGASGAPVLDRTGAVLGVHLAWSGKNGTIYTVIPAGVVRQALLSAKPALQPFSKLPKPTWPGQILRATGDRPDAADFKKALTGLKMGLKCKTCLGMGMIFSGYTGGRVPCTTCSGDKIVFSEGAYDDLATMAAQGARMAVCPDVALRDRQASAALAAEILQSVAKASQVFRPGVIKAAEKDLAKPLPRGVVVFAEVREPFKGPDGEYTCLASQSGQILAVKTEMLQEVSAMSSGGGGRRVAAQGDNIAIAGLALERFDAEGKKATYFIPFVWIPGPDLGPAPKASKPPDG
jgi:hypothetical protein